MRRALGVLLFSTSACMAGERLIDAPIAIEPQEPTIHRLTIAQYTNTMHALLGVEIVVPKALEPDASFGGFVSIGASRATISAWGVERYEATAYDLAKQALAMTEPRRALVPCQPQGVIDAGCASFAITPFGRRAFRRPLEAEEQQTLIATATTAADALGDFYQGLEFAVAAVLQSPSFLFRVELGEPDPAHPGERRYTNHEMASRLAFTLWDTTPDDQLLDAADKGLLVTDEGLKAEVARMLASPRAKVGLREFFTQLYQLAELDRLNKDPKVFTPFSADLGAVAREETLRDLEQIVFDLDGDYRDIFTSEHTFIDRRLAAIYGVRASAKDGFGEVPLSKSGGRRGLLGQVSFLALNAHPVSSSATLRGKFIRKVLLCNEIPPPPVNVNAALPPPSGTARTLREREKEHLSNPACRTCHLKMDPIGLGLEAFDGIGRSRTQDNGAPIDPASDLDGKSFADAWDLGQVLHDHPSVPRCLVRGLYRYMTGEVESEGESAQLEALVRDFERAGYRIRALVSRIALSPGFRRAREMRP